MIWLQGESRFKEGAFYCGEGSTTPGGNRKRRWWETDRDQGEAKKRRNVYISRGELQSTVSLAWC